jgi:hypothetical protein
MMRTFAIGFGDFTHYFNFHWASIFYLFEALTMPPVEVSSPDTSEVYTDTRRSSLTGHGNYGEDLDPLESSCRPCGTFSSLSSGG